MVYKLRSSIHRFKNHVAWNILVKTVKPCFPIIKISGLVHVIDHNGTHATISVLAQLFWALLPKGLLNPV